MSGENGTNGKHTKTFKFKHDADNAFVTDCPAKDCGHGITVYRNDYYMKQGPIMCELAHGSYVWYSPTKNTYMVTSA